MFIDLSIAEATIADLEDLIALRCEAAEEDVLTRFLYGHRHSEAVAKEGASLRTSLGRRFTHPTNRCHILKAVDSCTSELVGWALVRWEDGTWVNTNTAPTGSVESSSLSSHYQLDVKAKWRAILAGKPHVVIGALNVKFSRQRQGIGKQLIDYIYSTFNLGDELVAVQTRSSAEMFWSKQGWTTVDSTDIDLSQWGGKGRGYGLHRSPQMLRYPQSQGPILKRDAKLSDR